MQLNQVFQGSVKGRASFKLALDLYNRTLSGWEPVIEPWLCKANWEQSYLDNPEGCQKDLTIKVEC